MPDLAAAEQRLADLRRVREHAPDAEQEGPTWSEVNAALWAQYEEIHSTAPRNLADCAVKIRVMLGPEGFDGPGVDGIEQRSLAQVLRWMEPK